MKKASLFGNKKTRQAIVLILSLCLFSSCSGLDDGLVSTPAVTSSARQTSGAGQFDNQLDVLFVGNSLTDGIIPSKFLTLSGYGNKSVNIFQLLGSGRKLSQHLITLKEMSGRKTGNNLTLIDKADIVILQEHVTVDIGTVESVTEIQKLFDADTKFYYLFTEFDIPRVSEIKELENISIIPSGYVHELLLENGFSYELLHLLNDFHPNSLYGYASALMVYSVIYDTDCIGMPYDFLDAKTIELIPGTTKTEKDLTVLKIQELVMEAIEMARLDFPFSSK